MDICGGGFGLPAYEGIVRGTFICGGHSVSAREVVFPFRFFQGYHIIKTFLKLSGFLGSGAGDFGLRTYEDTVSCILICERIFFYLKNGKNNPIGV